MVTVELATPVGDTLSVTGAAGERLLDLFDEAAAPMVFSCRSASCGVCRVDVETGSDLLAPPEEDERETLDAFSSPHARRLACQVRLCAASGLVRLVAVDDR